jgi:hypothetical protein
MQYNQFLESYRIYTANNETPEIFHIWIGLSILAGACEKRLWLDRGYFNVYSNLYIILISPAGLASKSTSMDLGQQMLEEAGYHVMYGSTSKEKIIIDLCNCLKPYKITETKTFLHSSATYVSDELNVLLSTGSDMIKFLVDIWGKGSSYSYRTKNAGIFEITNPFFNLLTAVVPQWFGTNLANDLSATGLLARCILINADDKRAPWDEPFVGPKELAERDNCVSILGQIGRMYGVIKLSDEARRFYHDWYMDQKIDKSEDYRMAAYLERRNKVQILKLALLMATGDVRNVIEVVDFQRALNIFQLTDTSMRNAYLMAGSNRLAPYTARVISMLDANHGRIKLADVTRILMPDVAYYEMKQIISSLMYMDEATLDKDKHGVAYLVKKGR